MTTVTVNTHEAKTQLSRLLARVEQGDDIVIARAGKPIARLVPCDDRGTEVRLGTGRGLIVFTEGWDDPLTDEELESFCDSPIFPPDLPE